MRHFFILGNGHSGTSLLRGLLHSHTRCRVYFEDFQYKKREMIDKQFKTWAESRDNADRNNLLFGNKVPIEQFITAHWNDDDIIRIMDEGYYVIWIQRRFSKYDESDKCKKHTQTYQDNWDWGQLLYWKMKEKYPINIVQVAFEDILFQPVPELFRLCAFLEIDYQQEMIENGANNTGHFRYKYNSIDISRI